MGYVEALLGREEHILFETRQHLTVVIRQLLLYGILSLIIILAALLLMRGTGDRRWLLLLLAFIPVGAKFVVDFLNWWNREYIVTNRRVIKTEGVFNKHVVDSSLEKVNDVVLTQTALGRLMNYGDVEIITGSDIGVNQFQRIANPVAFKTAMLNAKEGLGDLDDFNRSARSVLASDEAPRAADIPTLIANLADLRDRGIISHDEFERKKQQLLERL
ncbi:MAG: PH domain-containing protein [Ardenticatenaceae bacterium]|nr:PH domain-containing protein [Ardenticatenaceae bacterium]HBY93635.1 hypothetical protein [Chloroflexota bacterium]